MIAAMVPVGIMANEGQRLYDLAYAVDESCTNRRQDVIWEWQKRKDDSTKGHWTHRIIPDVSKWITRRHGEVYYGLTQFLSGHGASSMTTAHYARWFRRMWNILFLTVLDSLPKKSQNGQWRKLTPGVVNSREYCGSHFSLWNNLEGGGKIKEGVPQFAEEGRAWKESSK